MITVTKEMRTETAHRLMNYAGKCAHLHGHSYLWRVTASAEVDERAIAVDFKDLKKAMEQVIGPLDHALVIRQDDPLGQNLELLRATNSEPGRVFRWLCNPTAEAFAAFAARELQALLGTAGRIERVEVWETATSFAAWTRVGAPGGADELNLLPAGLDSCSTIAQSLLTAD